MARTAITKQARSRSGLTATTQVIDASASPNGMSFVWSPTAEVVLANTDASSHTMTVALNVPVGDGITVPGKAVTIPVTSTNLPLIVGPFDAKYKQDDGNVYLNFDASTGLKIAVVD